ncbi:hypothetical protein JCM3766R1_005257 [Sporobolomyces carnicolor]
MESLGGFIDPSLSTPRPSTPSTSSPSNSTPTKPSDSPAPSSATSSGADAAATREGGQESTTLDLDKEVQNVIAGFGSFWGKVRKQSTAVFSTAEKQFESTLRKDLNPLLSKAKANLDQFSTAARAEVQRLSETPTSNQSSGVVIGSDGVPIIVEAPEDVKGKGVDRSNEPDVNPSAAASAFFSKVQHQLASMQDQAPQALHSLSTNFSQFQDQLSHLNLGSATTSEYLHKGETWFNEFKDEVSKLAKDAVQIVPPTATQSRTSEEITLINGMTRKDTLLYRLRSDPSAFLVDPSLPPLPSATDSTDHRSAYSDFLSTLPSTAALADSDQVKLEREKGGQVLERTRRDVVAQEGGQIDDEEFWRRYLFRVHLIEQDEEKRKKVLSVTQTGAEEDEFSWDMDEEESATAGEPHAEPETTLAQSPSDKQDTTLTSTREEPAHVDAHPSSNRDNEREATPTRRRASSSSRSSDGTRTSYDIVGEKSGNPSVDGENAAEDETRDRDHETAKKAQAVEEEDEDDSDWE